MPIYTVLILKKFLCTAVHMQFLDTFVVENVSLQLKIKIFCLPGAQNFHDLALHMLTNKQKHVCNSQVFNLETKLFYVKNTFYCTLFSND